MNTSVAQVDADIMRRVHANIQGFELRKFFQDSESIKTDIIVNEIEGLDLTCQLSFEKMPVNTEYPENRFQLFGFRKKGVICDETIKTRTIYDGRDYNIFLIAIDTSSSELIKPIKYVSGQMFLDNISYDFELNNKLPDSYIDYIKVRMYALQVDKLKFLNKKSGILYYQGYSNFEKKQLKLAVDTNTWNNKIEIETWL
tara:strand:- start:55 stop:651 length:597 start_codon:yes stop_codon:yes gene_type:complete